MEEKEPRKGEADEGAQPRQDPQYQEEKAFGSEEQGVPKKIPPQALPENIRKEYKDISKFTKEYLPKFTKETKTKIEELKKIQTEQEKTQNINKTQDEIQKQIAELQQQLNKGEKNV